MLVLTHLRKLTNHCFVEHQTTVEEFVKHQEKGKETTMETLKYFILRTGKMHDNIVYEIW